MADRKPAFEGKTITAKVPTRGPCDPLCQKDSFVQFYPQFYENFEDLDGDTKADFQARGNDVLGHKNVGDAIVSGDGDQCQEELE